MAASDGGFWDVCKWLWSVSTIVDHTVVCHALSSACEIGHVEFVQWLWHVAPQACVQDAELAFDTACDHGHLAMAKWLLKAHPALDVYAQGERPFCTTCAKGYLEFAQWLWAQRGHARWQNALVDASQHSHAHVVQWLLRVATEEGGFHTHLNRTYVCIAVAYAPNLDVARAILRVCPISESVIVWNTLKRRRDLAMGRWLLAQGWNPQGDVQWLQMWSPARAVWIQSVVSLHAPFQKSSSDK